VEKPKTLESLHPEPPFWRKFRPNRNPRLKIAPSFLPGNKTLIDSSVGRMIPQCSLPSARYFSCR
jgi:hypothetical protein